MLIRQKNQHLIPPDHVLATIIIGGRTVLKEKFPCSGHEKEDAVIRKSAQPHDPLIVKAKCPKCGRIIGVDLRSGIKRTGECPKCKSQVVITAKPLANPALRNSKYFVHIQTLLEGDCRKANKFIAEGGSQYAEDYGVSHVEIVTKNLQLKGPYLEGSYKCIFTINNLHRVQAEIVFKPGIVKPKNYNWLTPIVSNKKEKHFIECAIGGFVGCGICYRGER